MGRWAVGKPNCGIANSRTKMRTTADCSQLTTEIENSAEQSAKRRCCCRGVVVAFAFAASLLPLTRRHRCRTQTALPHRPLAVPLPHRLFATATGCSHPPSGPKAMSHEPAARFNKDQFQFAVCSKGSMLQSLHHRGVRVRKLGVLAHNGNGNLATNGFRAAGQITPLLETSKKNSD